MFTQRCGAVSVEYIAGCYHQECSSNYYLYFTTLGLGKCAAMTSFQDCGILKVHWLGPSMKKSLARADWSSTQHTLMSSSVPSALVTAHRRNRRWRRQGRLCKSWGRSHGRVHVRPPSARCNAPAPAHASAPQVTTASIPGQPRNKFEIKCFSSQYQFQTCD